MCEERATALNAFGRQDVTRVHPGCALAQSRHPPALTLMRLRNTGRLGSALHPHRLPNQSRRRRSRRDPNQPSHRQR